MCKDRHGQLRPTNEGVRAERKRDHARGRTEGACRPNDLPCEGGEGEEDNRLSMAMSETFRLLACMRPTRRRAWLLTCRPGRQLCFSCSPAPRIGASRSQEQGRGGTAYRKIGVPHAGRPTRTHTLVNRYMHAACTYILGYMCTARPARQASPCPPFLLSSDKPSVRIHAPGKKKGGKVGGRSVSELDQGRRTRWLVVISRAGASEGVWEA